MFSTNPFFTFQTENSANILFFLSIRMHLLGMTARGRGMPPLNRPVAASSRPGPAPFQLLSAWKVSLLQESVIPADQNRDHGLPGTGLGRSAARLRAGVARRLLRRFGRPPGGRGRVRLRPQSQV